MQSEYEFISGWVNVTVTAADVKRGNASDIIAGQINNKVTEMAHDGWEFYQTVPIKVTVFTPGCLAYLWRLACIFLPFDNGEGDYSTYILVFRRLAR